jgi:predicted regulator of Ras-like GTPase activity (Roadblock/LC7/MglB family)
VFKQMLAAIVDRVEGAMAISLIGLDGIAIESVNPNGVAIESMGAELGGFVKSIRIVSSDLDSGDVQQLTVVTDRYAIFLSAVTHEYFVLLVIAANGNYGRARFELARARQPLRAELV